MRCSHDEAGRALRSGGTHPGRYRAALSVRTPPTPRMIPPAGCRVSRSPAVEPRRQLAVPTGAFSLRGWCREDTAWTRPKPHPPHTATSTDRSPSGNGGDARLAVRRQLPVRSAHRPQFQALVAFLPASPFGPRCAGGSRPCGYMKPTPMSGTARRNRWASLAVIAGEATREAARIDRATTGGGAKLGGEIRDGLNRRTCGMVSVHQVVVRRPRPRRARANRGDEIVNLQERRISGGGGVQLVARNQAQHPHRVVAR